MKKAALLRGTEVIVKVPFKGTVEQIRGTITAISDSTITVTETVEDDRQPRSITLPKASVEALAFIANPNYPEAEVEDGMLLVNGTPVPTGFVPQEVIVTLPNRVYVTTKAEDSDRVEIYSYNVGKDEFYKATASMPIAISGDVISMGSSILIPFENKATREETIKKEDGTTEKKEYEVLEASGYFLISTETGLSEVCITDGVEEKIIETKSADVENKSAVFVTTAQKTTENDVEREYDEYDDEVEEAGRIIPVKDSVIVRVYKVTGRHLSPLMQTKMTGEYMSTVAGGRTTVIKTDKQIFAVVDGRTYEINNKYVLSQLSGYNFIVKDEVKNGVTKLWFTNDDLSIKVYTLTPAEDARGPIETVE